ncbi:MAG TPA: replicative DNA helicase [Lachnospiraceae bacterium]|nr:replicative DNA helicase [Lachnospiraceae bacterium]
MEEALIKRVMPHDEEAEGSVIGAMLLDNEKILAVSEIITGEDFYQKQRGVVYDTMVELYNEGKPVEPTILHTRLKEKGLPEEVCSVGEILHWMNQPVTSANIKHYAKIVAERAVARRLIRLNEEIANACYACSRKVDDVLEEAEKRIFDLVRKGSENEFVPIRKVVVDAMKKIDAASRTRGRVTGLETGFMDLDYKTSGLQPSDLVLIAARPSMGKTAFVLNMAQHMAFKKDLPVAIFSLEMSKDQLVNRMLSLESHVDAQKIRTGRLTDEDWMNLVEGSANIANSRLVIDDTPGITLPTLRSKCRKLKLEYGIQIVIIDYLQLMSGDTKSNSASRQQEISDISRGLKALARELNVPVVALSQLSRAVEQRPDHRPMLSDLRESGAIEQDADVVMFLYREGYYNRDLSEAEQRVAEVIIAKQRNGPIGTVNLLWMPELTKFTDIDRSLS